MERNGLGFIPAIYSVWFCLWVPQYTTETFVVLSSPFKNVSARDQTYDLLLQNAPLYLLQYTTATYTYELATEIYLPAPTLHTAVPSALPRFPHYIAGVSEYSIHNVEPK